MATNAQIVELIEVQTAPLRQTIERLTQQLSQLVTLDTVTEYRIQSIDEGIRCEESLDVIKSLPNFDGKNSYVSWREAAGNSIKLYIKGSRKYFAALTILRNKITDNANDILTNHGTVLNFDAIISRLDFAYADKRPLHIIEQELSVMRQGSLSIIDYYNEINKKLTALINKTIMTHGSESELTKELNKKNRQYALRVFITGLNAPLANILFSLSPSDLPNALAKAQELESNNIRANFASQFNRSIPHNNNQNNNHQRHANVLRFPQGNQKNPQAKYRPARYTESKPQPMEVGSSANVVAKQPQNSYNGNFRQGRPYYPNNNYQSRPSNNNNNNNNNNSYQQREKRPMTDSGQVSQQPQAKTQRVNNLNDASFLEQETDCPTSSGQRQQEENAEF